jgi:hypothetical protein
MGEWTDYEDDSAYYAYCSEMIDGIFEACDEDSSRSEEMLSRHCYQPDHQDYDDDETSLSCPCRWECVAQYGGKLSYRLRPAPDRPPSLFTTEHIDWHQESDHTANLVFNPSALLTLELLRSLVRAPEPQPNEWKEAAPEPDSPQGWPECIGHQ